MDTTFQLDVCGEYTVEDPTDEEIRSGLAELDQIQNDAFAILSQSEETYMQTAGDRQSGFVLEYQEGDLNNHYQATNRQISLAEVTAAFMAFRRGLTDWKTRFTWEKINL